MYLETIRKNTPHLYERVLNVLARLIEKKILLDQSFSKEKNRKGQEEEINSFKYPYCECTKWLEFKKISSGINSRFEYKHYSKLVTG